MRILRKITIRNSCNNLAPTGNYVVQEKNKCQPNKLEYNGVKPKIIALTNPVDHAKILDEASDPLIALNSDYQFTYANKAFAQALGKTLEVIIGNDLWGIYQKDGADFRRDVTKEVFETGQTKVVENVVPKPSGNLYFITTFKPIFNEQNIVISVVAIAKDITDRKQAEKALRESESRIRGITDSAQNAILMMDPEGRISYWNPAAERILGYTNTEAIGQDLRSLLAPSRYHEAHQAAFPLFQQKGLGALVGKTLDLDAIRKDGKEIPVQLSLSAVYMECAWQAVGILRDITGQKMAEEKIRQMAYHDSLTGLPNRKLFSDRLGIALTQAQRNKKEVGIAMLDLDNFKEVNDTLGHAGGGLLLKAAAERLSAALRKSDTVARMGGDEFVLILPELKGMEDAIQVAQKIVDSFRKPFLIDTHQLVVTTSIGIAVYPNDGMDGDILLKNADIAMYQAKEAGRDRYQIYNKT